MSKDLETNIVTNISPPTREESSLKVIVFLFYSLL